MTRIRILVPTDFSPAAETAAAFAAHIARASKGALTFMHVRNEKKTSIPEMEDRLSVICEKISNGHSLDCNYLVRDGNIFREIPALAYDKEYRMVVIATHGVQGLRQMMMGADILRLIRAIPIPVLVVQEGSRVPAEGFKRMVFPVGGHARFDRQIDAALMMAGIFDLEIMIYSVRKKGDEWTATLKKNLQDAESAFTTRGIRFVRVNEEPNVLSVGYARQTLKYAANSSSDVISIMSVPTREHYYFAQADKEEMLCNEHMIPVLCSSDLDYE